MSARIACACFLFIVSVIGRAETTSDIHLFQNYTRDAVISDIPYDEIFSYFRIYNFGSTSNIGLKGGFALSPQFEINGELSLATLSHTGLKSEFGLSDFYLSGRFLVYNEGPTTAALGVELTLPFGDSEVGYGNGGFGIFGALRQSMGSKSFLTATAGLATVQESPGSQNSLSAFSLGGGFIHQLKPGTHLVIEAVIMSKINYLMISGGLDHRLDNGAHLRAMLGMGATENAPDVWISLGYVFSF